MTDQYQQALLESSVAYVRGKLAFQNAILAAQRAGVETKEIARTCGLTVRQVEAVLRSP